jgi:hypothetical protein
MPGLPHYTGLAGTGSFTGSPQQSGGGASRMYASRHLGALGAILEGAYSSLMIRQKSRCDFNILGFRPILCTTILNR